jgi:hypothetical protein
MTWGPRVLALSCLCSAAACYSYAPVRTETVGPGEDVRVTITRAAAERREAALPQKGTRLEGTVVRTDPGSLWLSVTTSTRQSGFQFEEMAQTVQFDWGETLEVERKTLHRGRTYLAVGGAVAAVTAIAWTALGGETGDSSRPGPGDGVSDDPVLWILPILRFALPFP